MTRRNLPVARAAWPIVAAALVSCGPEPAPVIGPPRATAQAASIAPAAEVVPAQEQALFEQPPACSSDRYCWENPFPAVGALTAMWAASDRDIYAVGPGGDILHFDGASWRLERSSKTGALMSVWGSGPDDVYVGGAGEVLHRKGGVWKREVLDGHTFLQALWGSGPDDVYAVGAEGASFHHDGRQWQDRPTGTKADLRAVWGSGPKDVYAVGSDEKGGVLLHGDGASWEVLPRLGRSLVGVWGTGPDAVWVAGKDDREELAVWRLAGAQWQQEKVPAGGEAMALSGAGGNPVVLGFELLDDKRGVFGPRALFTAQLAGDRWARRDLFVVVSPFMDERSWGLQGEAQGSVLVAGGWGVVGRGDSSGFQSLTGNVALGKNLTGVWGTSPTDVVAVGAEGALLHYDGKAWSPDPSGKGIRFTGIHGSKDVLVASARGGKLLVRKGGVWTALASGTSKDLLAVWTDGDEIFAGGDEGTVIRCAGGKCAPMKTKIEASIYRIWGRSPKEVYVVAETARLFRFFGNAWRELPGPGSPGVKVINPRSRPDGEEGLIHISAIAPAPGGGVIVERSDGSYRVEGDTWTRLGDGGALALTDGSDGELRAVYGGSFDGTPTRARRFDGESWHDEALPLAEFDVYQLHMAGIWSGGGEVFLVGDAGAILHRRP